MTGQLEEEKMQVYVRLGIRLLYKGAMSRMEGARSTFDCSSLTCLRQCLRSLGCSSSTPPQVSGLKVEEILDPIDSFSTFLRLAFNYSFIV